MEAGQEMAESILVVVAHPDDESFLFGGRMLDRRAEGVDVIVATDGGATGFPALRRSRLEAAAQTFGFRILSCGSQPDREEAHLDFPRLVRLLSSMARPHLQEVWTHSPMGDFQAHWHHRQVALACALVFGEAARFHGHGFLGDGDGHRLSAETYRRKVEALHRCYPDEAAALEVEFGWYTREHLVQIRDVEEVAQIVAWSAEPRELGFLDSQARILDPWRRRVSLHERRLLDACLAALSARSEHWGRVVAVGDSQGLLCARLLREGIAVEVTAIEPLPKHHPGLSASGIRPVAGIEEQDIRADLAVVVQPRCAELGRDWREVARSLDPRALLLIDVADGPPASPWGDGHPPPQALAIEPATCEIGESSGFPFRYPASAAWLLSRAARRPA